MSGGSTGRPAGVLEEKDYLLGGEGNAGRDICQRGAGWHAGRVLYILFIRNSSGRVHLQKGGRGGRGAASHCCGDGEKRPVSLFGNPDRSETIQLTSAPHEQENMSRYEEQEIRPAGWYPIIVMLVVVLGTGNEAGGTAEAERERSQARDG